MAETAECPLWANSGHAAQKDMFASPLKAVVAFRALTTDFSRVGRPLFRHPDWFAAIRASLPFRRHSWRRHVDDPITDNAQSAVDYVVQSIAPTNLMLADGASCSSYRNKFIRLR